MFEPVLLNPASANMDGSLAVLKASHLYSWAVLGFVAAFLARNIRIARTGEKPSNLIAHSFWYLFKGVPYPTFQGPGIPSLPILLQHTIG